MLSTKMPSSVFLSMERVTPRPPPPPPSRPGPIPPAPSPVSAHYPPPTPPVAFHLPLFLVPLAHVRPTLTLSSSLSSLRRVQVHILPCKPCLLFTWCVCVCVCVCTQAVHELAKVDRRPLKQSTVSLQARLQASDALQAGHDQVKQPSGLL